jgi:hypothetical protein
MSTWISKFLISSVKLLDPGTKVVLQSFDDPISRMASKYCDKRSKSITSFLNVPLTLSLNSTMECRKPSTMRHPKRLKFKERVIE